MSNDPKREYCNCGYNFTPSLFMKIIMLIRGRYVKTCPRCGTVMKLHMSHFVYVKERKVNQKRMELWKNG